MSDFICNKHECAETFTVEIDGSTPVKYCPCCGDSDISETCPMCGNSIDSDTRVCPECRETV